MGKRFRTVVSFDPEVLLATDTYRRELRHTGKIVTRSNLVNAALLAYLQARREEAARQEDAAAPLVRVVSANLSTGELHLQAQDPVPCDGAGQYPCPNKAAIAVRVPDGDDCETARSVTMCYCAKCYRELYPAEDAAFRARVAAAALPEAGSVEVRRGLVALQQVDPEHEEWLCEEAARQEEREKSRPFLGDCTYETHMERGKKEKS